MESGMSMTRRLRDGEIALLKPAYPPFWLSRAETTALTRLIRSQLAAYAEAVSGIPRREEPPLTEADLGMMEPLLEWLEPRR